MARSFVAASSQYAESTTVDVTATPFTVTAWVKPTATNAGLTRTVFWLGNPSVNNNYWMLSQFNATAVATSRNTTSYNSSLSGLSTSAWTFIGGTFTSSTARQVRVASTNGTTETTSSTPSSISRMAIGARSDTAIRDPFDGLIAEVAIWGYALSSLELTDLQGGMSPLEFAVEPLHYWRFKVDHGTTTETDLGTSPRNLTIVNSPTYNADHPTVDDPPVTTITEDVGLTTSTNTALSVSISSAKSRDIGQATESESALNLGVNTTPNNKAPITLSDFDLPNHLNIRTFRESLKPLRLTLADLGYHSVNYWEGTSVSEMRETDAPTIGNENWLTYGLDQDVLNLMTQDELNLLTQAQIQSAAGIGRVVGWRYNSGIVVGVPTTGRRFTSVFDYDDLLQTPFDDPGKEYYIELVLRNFPAQVDSPTFDLDESFISFSTSLTNAPSQTVEIPFSDSITDITGGGDVVWRVNRDALNAIDASRIRRIDFYMVAVDDPTTFEAESLRLVDEDYPYYEIGINTKTGTLAKNPSETGTEIEAQPDPQPVMNVGSGKAKDFSEIIKFYTGHHAPGGDYNHFVIYLRADIDEGEYIEVNLQTNEDETIIQMYEGGTGLWKTISPPLEEEKNYFLELTLNDNKVRAIVWDSVGNYPTSRVIDTGEITVTRDVPGWIAYDLMPYNSDFDIDYMFARDASTGEMVTRTFNSITPIKGLTLYSDYSPALQILDRESSEEGPAVNLLQKTVQESGANNGDFVITPQVNDVTVSLDTSFTYDYENPYISPSLGQQASFKVVKHLRNAFIGGLQWEETVKINNPLNTIIRGAVRFDNALNFGKFRVVMFDKFWENVAFVSEINIEDLVLGKWNEFEIPVLNERIYTNEFKIQFHHVGIDSTKSPTSPTAIGTFWLDGFRVDSDSIVWQASNNGGASWMRFFDTINNQYQGVHFPTYGKQLKIRARSFSNDAWINGYNAIVHYAQPGNLIEPDPVEPVIPPPPPDPVPEGVWNVDGAVVSWGLVPGAFRYKIAYRQDDMSPVEYVTNELLDPIENYTFAAAPEGITSPFEVNWTWNDGSNDHWDEDDWRTLTLPTPPEEEFIVTWDTNESTVSWTTVPGAVTYKLAYRPLGGTAATGYVVGITPPTTSYVFSTAPSGLTSPFEVSWAWNNGTLDFWSASWKPVSTNETPPPPPPPPPAPVDPEAAEVRPFTPDHPIYARTTSSTPIDASSSSIITTYAGLTDAFNCFIDTDGDSPPVYIGKSTDPLWTITADSAPFVGRSYQVRAPSGIVAGTGTDYPLVILDPASAQFGGRRMEYRMWQATIDSVNRTINATNMGIGPYNNDRALYSNGLPAFGRAEERGSNTGSGNSYTVGMVRPHEIAAGEIRHAIRVSSGYTATDGSANAFRHPANVSDGAYGTYPPRVPMGSRIFLPSNVNMSAIDAAIDAYVDGSNMNSQARAAAKVMARAIRDYGLCVLDSRGSPGGFSFYMEGDQTANWATILGPRNTFNSWNHIGRCLRDCLPWSSAQVASASAFPVENYYYPPSTGGVSVYSVGAKTVTWPSGQFYGVNNFLRISSLPMDFNSSNAVKNFEVEYTVTIPSTFRWSNGGWKTPGPGGTSTGYVPNGCEQSSVGWSARLQWDGANSGGGGLSTAQARICGYPYLLVPGPPNVSGVNVQQTSNGGNPCGTILRPTSSNAIVNAGQTVTVKQVINLNTPGQSNGRMRIYRDNILILDHPQLRFGDNAPLTHLVESWRFGGTNTSPQANNIGVGTIVVRKL